MSKVNTEAITDVTEFADKYNLTIGSLGFSETGELEKVYLFKSRAKSPASYTLPIPEAKPPQ